MAQLKPVPLKRHTTLSQMVQKLSRARIMRVPLFLRAKFGRMRLQPTSRRAQRVFHVQHFMIEDEFHRVGRHIRMIQPPVHYNLIERRIETSKLGTPGPCAPSKTRAGKLSCKIFPIERREHRREIVSRAIGPMIDAARAFQSHSSYVPPRRVSQRILAIEIAQIRGDAPPVHLTEKDGRRSFNDRHRSVPQNIGKPNARDIVPQAHGVREIGVRIEFDHKIRRPSLASQTRENALKYPVAPWKRGRLGPLFLEQFKLNHCGFLRTGGGAISFAAFSTSLAASCVASMASSRLSLYVSFSGPFSASS